MESHLEPNIIRRDMLSAVIHVIKYGGKSAAIGETVLDLFEKC